MQREILSRLDQLGRQRTPVVEKWNILLSRKTVNTTIEGKWCTAGSVEPFNLPNGQDRPQEFTMAPAYEKPDLSCSLFVAKGSNCSSGGPRAAGESGFGTIYFWNSSDSIARRSVITGLAAHAGSRETNIWGQTWTRRTTKGCYSMYRVLSLAFGHKSRHYGRNTMGTQQYIYEFFEFLSSSSCASNFAILRRCEARFSLIWVRYSSSESLLIPMA